jgi:uncharacterized protein
MHTIHITLLFAGLCALIQCALTGLVIARRTQSGVSLLDGGDQLLRERIRAHGNFTETVPIALIMLALLEQGGLAAAGLWALGSLLVLGRVLHAGGLIGRGPRWARTVGMVLTLSVLSIGGVLCVALYFW